MAANAAYMIEAMLIFGGFANVFGCRHRCGPQQQTLADRFANASLCLTLA
jgi:hypothetical protein